MSETVPTKAAAEACDTTPKTLRQFLRASKDYQNAGAGGRYAFEASQLPTLKKRFNAWVAEREAAAKARAEAAAAEAASTPGNDAGETTGDAFARLPEPADDAPLEPPAKPARARKTA
ncbi:hypothetical protein [Pseudonocardia alaniniphila]|uniref:Uncharacterized protein n=1 Tax=Pseudonocardia alaniniphila TaxID=75291 RepID=A0ABS9T9V1_9PSEU|nr:hypothetical protein [Pseudonocardia alaniniphila]MCH6165309.1 hypothetical protein [Pseudonocardia alaniniphila]